MTEFSIRPPSPVPSFDEVDVSAGSAPRLSAEEEAAVLREMLLAMPEGVCYSDADGPMRLCNDAYLASQLTTRAEQAGLRTAEARFRWRFETGRQRMRHATLQDCIANMAEYQVKDREELVRNLDGRWLQNRRVLLRGGRVMSLWRDVTELKEAHRAAERARAEAEASDLAKSRTLADLRREARTPMHGLLDAMEALGDGGLTPGQASVLAQMRQAATAILRLLDDALAGSATPAVPTDPALDCGATGPHAAMPAWGAASPPSQRPRLLVADDHPVNREVIRQLLGLLGVEPEMAASGEAALAAWRARRHHVVLLDLHMPGLDGLQVARAIRAEEAAADLPRCGVLAVTADLLMGQADRCREAGMDALVGKPVSLADLATALERFVPGLVPRTGAADPAPPLFDPDVLRAQFDGFEGPFDPLIESFAVSAAQEVAEIAFAPAPAAVARRLAGSARTIGALRLADAAARIEAAARADEAAGLAGEIARLPDLLAATLRAARGD